MSVQSMKQHGNEQFNNQNFQKAIKTYTKILNSNKFKLVHDDDLSRELLLLKQSTYLMRGRANDKTGRIDSAQKDFGNCINIVDNTKYAYKAKLYRSMLTINNVEHWKRSKRDLESVISVRNCINTRYPYLSFDS